MIAQFGPFESKSTPGKRYTVQLADNGLLSCNCRGWTTQKKGQPRGCTHLDQVKKAQRFQTQIRDDNVFVLNAPPKGSKGAARMATAKPAPITPEVIATPAPASSGSSRYIVPMLASKMPDGKTVDDYTDGYLMEQKWDGHRVTVAISDTGKTIRAWSRPTRDSEGTMREEGLPRTMPDQIAAVLGRMPDGYYDGEMLVPGGSSSDVAKGSNKGNEVYVIFDVLELIGRNVMHESYVARRALLEIALGNAKGSRVVSLATAAEPSAALVQAIWDAGGEGVILKRKASRYVPGARTADWIKVKAQNHATTTIVGWEEGKNGPYSAATVRLPWLDKQGNTVDTTVKVLNNAERRAIEAHPTRRVGERLVISYQTKLDSGKVRHGMWDHYAADHE